MTDRLIHALSRQPVTRLVRPLAAFLLALALAYRRRAVADDGPPRSSGGVEAGQPGLRRPLAARRDARAAGRHAGRVGRSPADAPGPVTVRGRAVGRHRRHAPGDGRRRADRARHGHVRSAAHACCSRPSTPATSCPFAMHLLRDALDRVPRQPDPGRASSPRRSRAAGRGMRRRCVAGGRQAAVRRAWRCRAASRSAAGTRRVVRAGRHRARDRGLGPRNALPRRRADQVLRGQRHQRRHPAQPVRRPRPTGQDVRPRRR